MAIPSKTVAVGGVTQATQYDTLYNTAILANTGGTAGGAQSIPGEKTFQSATVFSATATFEEVTINKQLAITGASRVRAHRATTQPIPTITDTTMIYNVEDYDNLGEYIHTTGVLTFLKAGQYTVKAALMLSNSEWAAEEGGTLKLFKNGVVYSMLDYYRAGATETKLLFLSGSDGIEIAAGDYIEIKIYQNQGAAVNTLASAVYNYFSVHRFA